MIKLSKRLQFIADQVPAGSKVADIGSDHALLPSYLAASGIVPFAVAGEVNEGPYEAAASQIRESGLTGKVEARRGDGLAVLKPSEADVITIAGMGGGLISSILEAGIAKLAGVKLLILQPNVGEDFVRRWLIDHEWLLVNEQILEEDGKIYEILTAKRSPGAVNENEELYMPRLLAGGLQVTTEMLIRFGPYLIEQSSAVWHKKWELEIDKLEKICRQIAKSELESSKEKLEELRLTIGSTKEVLACLRTANP